MIRRILFVCSGNTCRSPMAEVLLRKKLARHASEWAKDAVVTSAGVSAISGSPASENATAAMKHKDLDLSEHQSKLLEAADIINADLVITMTRNHKKAVLALVPQALHKVYTLAELTALAELAHAKPEQAKKYRDMIQEVAQKTMELTLLLDQLLGNPPDIEDPFGGDLAEYEECARSISGHLDTLLQYLDQSQNQSQDQSQDPPQESSHSRDQSAED